MRRRDLLENVAFAQGREAQEGANTTSGWFSTKNADLLFDGARSLECVFVINNTTGTFQIPASFGSSMMALEITPAADSLKYYCGGLFIQTPVIQGKEYHAVITYDGVSAANAYLNGSLIGSFTPKSYVVSNYFTVGSSSGAYNFAGNVRLCRHYNYALSAADVAALWNGGDPAGYVLPEAWKTMPNSYDSDFTSGANGWVTHTLGTVVRAEDRVLRISSSTTDYKIRRRQEGALLKPAKYEIVVELAEPTIGPIRQFVYFPFSGMNGAVTRNIPAGTTLLRGMVSVDRELAEYSYLYFLGVDTPQTFKIKSISVKPVGCVAEYLPQNLVAVDGIGKSWLDSSRQLPLNDEHLPPLRGSIGGYDLTASGAPKIAHKPTLCQTWRKMSPMTLEGLSEIKGATVPPQIVDGAIRITCSEINKSYAGGGNFDKIVTANVGDVVKWRFKIRASSIDVQVKIGMAKSGNLYYVKTYANISAEWTLIEEDVTSSYPLDNFWIAKYYEYAGPGWFEIKDIEILIYRK